VAFDKRKADAGGIAETFLKRGGASIAVRSHPDCDDGGKTMKCRFVIGAALAAFMLMIGPRAAAGQTLLTQTTWGGAGAEFTNDIATAADGSAYAVGVTDSFATDQFNQPSPRIFVVKFAPDGSVTWQRIWSGVSFGRAAVAVGTDGAVFVSGATDTNGIDAVVLKFDPNGNLIWVRTWGGPENDGASAVATATDGSVYVAGRTTSFGPSSAGMFVVKFDGAGNVVWQRLSDNSAGVDAVAVGTDGSVYAAGSVLRGGDLSQFDILILKMTADGTEVWRRTYSAGEVVDARGRMAAAPDGSIVIAGAIQAEKSGFVGIAPLIVKLDPDGGLVFNRTVTGASTADAVAVAADDGSIYVAGTTSASFDTRFQDAFLLHLQSTGKKALDAVAWGGAGFEEGRGVSVAGGTVVLAATTTTGPPYSLLEAGMKLSTPKSIVAPAAGALVAVAGTIGNSTLGAATPNGSTTYAGNFEAAVVRILR
jgi:hypothetical protein